MQHHRGDFYWQLCLGTARAQPGRSRRRVIAPGNKVIWAIFLLLTALELEEIPVREITGRMDMERVIFKQILERVFGVRDSERNLTCVPSEQAVQL